MPWTSKSKNAGSNDYSCTDPATESSHREFKHGHYYDGNMRTEAKDRLVKEGSKGFARDQGFIRTSAIPVLDEGGDTGQKIARIKTDRQGTHSHQGNLSNKKQRELKG